MERKMVTLENLSKEIELLKKKFDRKKDLVFKACYAFLGILVIIVCAFTYQHFRSYEKNITKIYDKNVQHYNNFISSLEAIDQSPDHHLGIKYDSFFANDEGAKEQYKNPEILRHNFLSDYYQVQSNWLNTWLAVLGIIMAVFAIIIPFMFIRFYESKKEEIHRLCDDIRDLKKNAYDDYHKISDEYTHTKKQFREISSLCKKIENDLNNKIKLGNSLIENINNIHKQAEDFQKKQEFNTQKENNENVKLSDSKSKNEIKNKNDFSLFLRMMTDLRGKNLNEQNYKDALVKINKLLEKDPSNITYLEWRGYINLKLNNNIEAIMDYSEVLNHKPDDTNLYLNRGAAYSNLKLYEKAEENYKKVLEIDPENADAMGNIALIYASQDKKDEAMKYFYKAISINDKHINNIINRAILHYDNNDFASSIKDYEKAIEIDNNSYVANYNLGTVYMAKLSNLTKAIEYLKRAVEIDPSNKLGLYNLFEALIMVDNYVEALTYLKQYVDNNDDAFIYDDDKSKLIIKLDENVYNENAKECKKIIQTLKVKKRN